MQQLTFELQCHYLFMLLLDRVHTGGSTAVRAPGRGRAAPDEHGWRGRCSEERYVRAAAIAYAQLLFYFYRTCCHEVGTLLSLPLFLSRGISCPPYPLPPLPSTVPEHQFSNPFLILTHYVLLVLLLLYLSSSSPLPLPTTSVGANQKRRAATAMNERYVSFPLSVTHTEHRSCCKLQSHEVS